MVVQRTRLEPGLYFAVWSGSLTREDFLQAADEARRLVDQHGDAHYIQLIDMRQVQVNFFDMKAIREAADADPRLIGVLSIGAPSLMRVAGEVIRNLHPLAVEYFESVGEAVERARQLLAQRKRGEA